MLLRVAFFASILGGMVFGYNTDVISGAILFIRDQFHLTTVATETAVSGVLWSGLIAVFLACTIADYLGRKPTFMISAFLVFVGPIISAIDGQAWTLDLGRYILGFGLGINTVVTPLYLSETAPARHRGKILAAYPCSLTAGGLLSNVVDISLAQQANWQIMLLLGAFPALVQFIGLFFICESPTWYKMRGQIDKARQSILLLQPSIPEEELNARLIISPQPRVKWRELFSQRVRISLLIGLILAAVEQATGIDSIEFYAPILFEQAGVKNATSALIATMIIASVGVSMTFVAVAMVDRIGRKPLLRLGLAMMTISLLGVALGFYVPNKSVQTVVVSASLFFYCASFNLSLGTLIWVLIPEVFSARYRAKGVSLALLVNWIFDAIVSQFYLSLVKTLGDSGLFFLFAALTLATYAFVQKYVSETSGREINSTS